MDELKCIQLSGELTRDEVKIKLKELFLSNDKVVKRFIFRFLKSSRYSYKPLLIKDYNFLVNIIDENVNDGLKKITRKVLVEECTCSSNDIFEIKIDEPISEEKLSRTSEINLPFISFNYQKEDFILTSQFEIIQKDALVSRISFDIRDRSYKIDGLFKEKNLFDALDSLENDDYVCVNRLNTPREIDDLYRGISEKTYDKELKSLGFEIAVERMYECSAVTPWPLLLRLCFASMDPDFKRFDSSRESNEKIFAFLYGVRNHYYAEFKTFLTEWFNELDLAKNSTEQSDYSIFFGKKDIHEHDVHLVDYRATLDKVKDNNLGFTLKDIGAIVKNRTNSTELVNDLDVGKFSFLVKHGYEIDKIMMSLRFSARCKLFTPLSGIQDYRIYFDNFYCRAMIRLMLDKPQKVKYFKYEYLGSTTGRISNHLSQNLINKMNKLLEYLNYEDENVLISPINPEDKINKDKPIPYLKQVKDDVSEGILSIGCLDKWNNQKLIILLRGHCVFDLKSLDGKNIKNRISVINNLRPWLGDKGLILKDD